MAARTSHSYLARPAGLGHPEDWFNGVGYRNRGVTDYPLDRESQLTMVRTRGATNNGIFGVKLSPVRCDELRHLDWASRLGPLLYIHLSREDHLGQAISSVRAFQTGQYRSTTPAKGKQVYDSSLIAKALTSHLVDEARVRRFFAVKGIVALEVTYEQLLSDSAEVVGRVGAFLGLDRSPIPDLSQIELQVQRDQTTELWRRRFLSDFDAEAPLAHIALERSPIARTRGKLKSLVR